MFDKCRRASLDFELGVTLKGVVTDWSDAEINGLRLAVGKTLAQQLLKACKVHWQSSCHCVAENVVSSADKAGERNVFLKIFSQVQILDSAVRIVACFETLCSVRSVTKLLEALPDLCTEYDVDKSYNWTKHRACHEKFGPPGPKTSVEFGPPGPNTTATACSIWTPLEKDGPPRSVYYK